MVLPFKVSVGSDIIRLEEDALEVATSTSNLPIAFSTGTSREDVAELTGTSISSMRFPLRSSNLIVTVSRSPGAGGLDRVIRTIDEFVEFPPRTLMPATSAEGGVGATGATGALTEGTLGLGGAGAGGGATGVAATALDATPGPTEFLALIFTSYAVPFVRPVRTIGLVVDGVASGVQSEPLSSE